MYTNQIYVEGFTTSKKDLEEILREVDEDLFMSLPADGGWCIGEVVSHINRTTDLYLLQMEGSFNKPTNSLPKGTGPYSLPWAMRMFVKVVSPDFNPKVRTFPVFYPEKKADLDREKIVSHFNENMDRFITIAERAETEELNLDKIKVRNPVLKVLKMSLSTCLAIHNAHTKRHLEQIKRLIPAKVN